MNSFKKDFSVKICKQHNIVTAQLGVFLWSKDIMHSEPKSVKRTLLALHKPLEFPGPRTPPRITTVLIYHIDWFCYFYPFHKWNLATLAHYYLRFVPIIPGWCGWFVLRAVYFFIVWIHHKIYLSFLLLMGIWVVSSLGMKIYIYIYICMYIKWYLSFSGWPF